MHQKANCMKVCLCYREVPLLHRELISNVLVQHHFKCILLFPLDILYQQRLLFVEFLLCKFHISYQVSLERKTYERLILFNKLHSLTKLSTVYAQGDIYFDNSFSHSVQPQVHFRVSSCLLKFHTLTNAVRMCSVCFTLSRAIYYEERITGS